MVRLRLRKVGAKARQSFRIVAADREHPRDGRFLEAVGFYNPRTNPATIELDEARVFHWLQHGAQPSESVGKLLKVTGTTERFERLKKGEAVETLVAEATAGAAARNTNPRTTGTPRSANRVSKKQKAASEKQSES
jgi:small subunit ribosomal protein S16